MANTRPRGPCHRPSSHGHVVRGRMAPELVLFPSRRKGAGGCPACCGGVWGRRGWGGGEAARGALRSGLFWSG